MADLYSRYVPPSKKQKTDAALPPSITKRSPPPVQQVMLDASSTHKRYVPSSKSKGTSSSQANPSARAETSSNGENLNDTAVGDVDIDPGRVKDDSIQDGAFQSDAMDVDTPPKRERKRKREKKSASKPKHVEGVVEADRESSEEDTRHASILERRNKSLLKAEKREKKTAKKASENMAEGIDEDVEMKENAELHALEPLPQPEPLPESTSKPKFSVHKSWITSPIKVGPSTTASFAALGIPENVISALGFKEAFAIQAAVLPLLLPGKQQQPGDVLVSAATGSGKTLAYVLPMINDISNTSNTRLRGLIVVPTKELVYQAEDACHTCADAFSDHKKHNNKRVKIGIAMGDKPLEKEQATLVNQEQRYEPHSYTIQEMSRNSQWLLSYRGSDTFVYRSEEDLSNTMPDHILCPTSKVDILICTPGRLVEHLKSTPGFTLQHLNWLVIDEADKLLDQSFQEWLGTIMPHLPTPRKFKNGKDTWANNSSTRRLRKIVLSATMTSDAGQLSSLKLHRPKLVVLEGEKNDLETTEDGKSLTLPATLHEVAIKVHDEAEKPLYLLELLRSQKMIGMGSQDVDDSSDTALSSDDGAESAVDTNKRGVIVFTRSNENALRLSRLLTLIDPTLEGAVGTSTSEVSSNKIRRKTLAAFQSGKISILVASDLVSRGLDIPGLPHVVNYDMPLDLKGYMHRVGRTARAGKKGSAWTLYTPTDAAWFLNDIARSKLINRTSKVEMHKINPGLFSEELRVQYEEALERLGQEVKGHN